MNIDAKYEIECSRIETIKPKNSNIISGKTSFMLIFWGIIIIVLGLAIASDYQDSYVQLIIGLIIAFGGLYMLKGKGNNFVLIDNRNIYFKTSKQKCFCIPIKLIKIISFKKQHASNGNIGSDSVSNALNEYYVIIETSDGEIKIPMDFTSISKSSLFDFFYKNNINAKY